MTFTENELKTAEGILWIKRSNCTDKERDLSIALDIAMKILRMQIPKKLIGGFKCASCDNDVTETYYHIDYCPFCGQKILWDSEV